MIKNFLSYLVVKKSQFDNTERCMLVKIINKSFLTCTLFSNLYKITFTFIPYKKIKKQHTFLSSLPGSMFFNSFNESVIFIRYRFSITTCSMRDFFASALARFASNFFNLWAFDEWWWWWLWCNFDLSRPDNFVVWPPPKLLLAVNRVKEFVDGTCFVIEILDGWDDVSEGCDVEFWFRAELTRIDPESIVVEPYKKFQKYK